MNANDWSKPNATSGALTREVFDAALKAIENQPPHPCSLGRHVVSADALRDGSKYAMCGNCARMVQLR